MHKELGEYESDIKMDKYTVTKTMKNDSSGLNFQSLFNQFNYYIKSLNQDIHHVVPTCEPKVSVKYNEVSILMRRKKYTLRDKIPVLTQIEKDFIKRQLVDIVQFFTQNGFICLDFKPDNILLDDDLVAFITDFGHGIQVDDPILIHYGFPLNRLIMATNGYNAPELYTENRYVSSKIDVYALGCTFFFMDTHFDPSSKSGSEMLEYFKISPYSQLFDNLKDKDIMMLQECLATDYQARIGIDDLKEIYFKQLE